MKSYKYNYVIRFNAVKSSFDGSEKYVQTYRLEFLVEQKDTSYRHAEEYLQGLIGDYKGQDLDKLKGKHFTLEDMAKEIFETVKKTDLFILWKLEISNSLVNTYILERN